MIRIIVSAPAKTGFYPYRIDGHWGPDGAPLIGIAEDPIAEACRVLQALGVELRTKIRIDAPHTRIGPVYATGTLGNFIKRVVSLIPPTRKALPPPRRRPRKRPVITGSGVPGDE